MSLSLSDLKKLHAKGFALIWLRPKSKRPFESGWTRDEPKTWAELENSFEKTYNVGVRLGKPSRLISGKYLGAIDCDVKSRSSSANNEMSQALHELGLDLETAPIVYSGRGNGSKHIYVQTDTPLQPGLYRRSKKRVKVLMPGETRHHSQEELKELSEQERKEGYRIRPAWEISFMGTGQQTVLPPSIHPDTGMKYAWVRPFKVKALPVFKPEHHKQPEKIDTDASTLDFEIENVDLYESSLHLSHVLKIVEGKGVEDRSADLLAVTMAMCRAGFTDNQILSVLSDPENWISSAAYEHTQSRSRARAVKWLHKYTLLKARYNTDVMRYFDNPPAQLVPLPPEKAEKVNKQIEAEQAHILPDLDGGGKPKPTLRNIVYVLEHFLSGGLVGVNEFNSRIYFLKDTPYGGEKGRELVGTDDLHLKHYIAQHYRFEPSKEVCFEAHTVVAHCYAYHPVKDYLTGLTWDKTPRLDYWLEKAMNARGPKEYVRAVSRKVLVAAVKRVFEPGCKFDYVVVLQGNQGEGKSSALSLLVGQEWFTDNLGDVSHKDVVDQMMGKWVIELGELAAIRKSETELVKAFLSRQVDRVRLPYERRSEDFPRQSIFIGSTNAQEIFSDETGNRRYWPVSVSGVDRGWVEENKDQLWAEAVMRYELGEDVYLTPELEKVAEREQEKRYEVDEWEAEIKRIVNKDPDGAFMTTELWRAINLTAGNGHPDWVASRRIGKIMHRLGFSRVACKIDGEVIKGWKKRG